jgi:hypothetical protein
MEKEQAKEVQLIITFQSPTSLNHRIATSGPIAAEQLVMIGQRLLDEGRFAWAMERQQAVMEKMEAREESKIVVPGVSPQEVERILREGKGGG